MKLYTSFPGHARRSIFVEMRIEYRRDHMKYEMMSLNVLIVVITRDLLRQFVSEYSEMPKCV